MAPSKSQQLGIPMSKTGFIVCMLFASLGQVEAPLIAQLNAQQTPGTDPASEVKIPELAAGGLQESRTAEEDRLRGVERNDAQARLQSRIAELIAQLGDGNYHQRESAKWELGQIGLAAFEQLRQASQTHPNAHVARATRYLIDSQDVVWWLETDSLEVRELLTNYNDSAQDDRDIILQQLSERGTPDALLALCRLVRFESSELRSKSAALYLMQTISEKFEREPDVQRAKGTSSLPASIELALGDSNRTATTWLLGLMNDLRVLNTSVSQAVRGETLPHASAADLLPNANLARWQRLIAQEHAEVAREAADKQTKVETSQALERFRSIAVTLRFYRWLGSWLTEHRHRHDALEVVRPSVRLIGSEAHSLPSLQTAAMWALESSLPELVIELAKTYPEQFAEAPELGFFLAEGHLRMGNEARAQLAARAASDSIHTIVNKNSLNFRNVDTDEIQANQHYNLADSLARRGLIQWAEQEYLRALTFQARISSEIRAKLAQFYWGGGEHQKAAEILKPVADEVLESRDMDLPTAPNVYNNPGSTLANYYFYSGLAALDRGDKVSASDFLRKSVETEFALPNPDAVIAMKQLGAEEPFYSYYREQFERMSKNFRIQVLQAEEQLARATDRMSRAMSGPNLASECNQLAWLLSKCDTNPEEAISLSLRSLELVPDEPAYLDTLARCYFAAGNLEQAARVQKRAVQLEPHERQMAAQLKEFEDALAPQ